MPTAQQSTTIRVPLKARLTSDHYTEATGKIVSVTISKNGGAFGNPSAGVVTATEISNGWYYVDLSTTDTNTLGPLLVRGTSASIDPAEAAYKVTVDAPQTGDAYSQGSSILSQMSTLISTTSAISTAWTTELTESYAADGATFTPAQALYMLWSTIAQTDASGTTLTSRRLNGSTAAMTFTLDSATTPTARTRAT